MQHATAILCLVLSTGISALAEEPAEVPEEPAVEPPVELTPEQLALLDEHRTEENRGFVFAPWPTPPAGIRPSHTGKWIEQDGVLMCDGYLTPVEDEDFCEAQAPANWRSFEFDGRTYYMQPLTENGG